MEGNISDEEKKVISDIIGTIGTIDSGASDIQNAVNGINQMLAGSGSSVTMGSTAGIDVSGSQVADSVNSSIGNMSEMLSMCSQSIENMQQVYVNSLCHR